MIEKRLLAPNEKRKILPQRTQRAQREENRIINQQLARLAFMIFDLSEGLNRGER
jgi:hypothetical protein